MSLREPGFRLTLGFIELERSAQELGVLLSVPGSESLGSQSYNTDGLLQTSVDFCRRGAARQSRVAHQHLLMRYSEVTPASIPIAAGAPSGG